MNNLESYRVQDKKNVHMNGKRTAFALYRKNGDAFVHVGAFTAPGWSQSDEKCVSAALATMDRLEDEARDN
jgi:hypothetical protein